MSSGHDALASPRRRLAVAVTASAAIVAAAPLAGVARSRLQAGLTTGFGTAVYAVIGVVVGAATVTGLWRAQRDLWWRVTVAAIAIAAASAYVLATGSADASIRAVEAFHFVEYGLITLLFSRVWRQAGDVSAMAMPALSAFLAGIAEEGYQWFLPARVGELRDVGLNGVAIACALLFSVGVAPPGRLARLGTAGAARMCRLLAVVVLALAAFVHVVHLGAPVAVGVTSFASRYSRAELTALAADRAARWRTAPPLVRPDRFSREDQYTTEGLQHVQARNTAAAGGDAATAWHENRILESAFAPVLDTPSYVSKGGHRWAPEQRAEIEARAGAARDQPFTSRAFPYPIYDWAPLTLWAVAGALAASLVWGAGQLRRETVTA